MGAEDFRVYLSTKFEASSVVRHGVSLVGVKRDTTLTALGEETYLVYEDAEHIVEMEVRPDQGGSRISIRFALCHPTSIDDVFARLVIDFAALVDATVLIAAEPDVGDAWTGTPFSKPGWAALSSTLKLQIPKCRALWIAEFGADQARLRCEDALERFVYPLADEGSGSPPMPGEGEES